MRKRQIFIGLMLLLVAVPIGLAERGEMTLLAVQRNGEQFSGGTAELILDTQAGTGRVFMDTFPLSELDTQVSIRFANEIACQYTRSNCNELDFFYTIHADSPLITGPSAGAAITALTVSVVDDIPINKEVGITGTINSGGLIGPVAGVKEKIEAGKAAGLKEVLIPLGTRFVNDANGSKLDLVEYGKQSEVNVVEVADIGKAMKEFSGRDVITFPDNLTLDPVYSSTMENLAQRLCNRTEEFISMINEESRALESYGIGLDMKSKGDASLSGRKFYSAASYCFAANVRMHYVNLVQKQESEENLTMDINVTDSALTAFRLALPAPKTITDLQTYGVVNERLTEAQGWLKEAKESLDSGDIDNARFRYAFAAERFSSARAWAEFFGKPGKKFDITDEALHEACLRKIGEVEERFQYFRSIAPASTSLQSSQESLDNARLDFQHGDYALCLYRASTAKADVDALLSTVSVRVDQVDEVIDSKMNIVLGKLVRQTKEGIFPIVGYSYYEYANSLRDEDKGSTLIFLEYALELGNLDIYFQEEGKEAGIANFVSVYSEQILLLSTGMALGIVISVAVLYFRRMRDKAYYFFTRPKPYSRARHYRRVAGRYSGRSYKRAGKTQGSFARQRSPGKKR